MDDAEMVNARKVGLTGTERHEIIAAAAPNATRFLAEDVYRIPVSELNALLDEAFLRGKLSGVMAMS